MIRRLFSAFCVAVAGVASIAAMPALPKLISFPQPDGSVAELYLRGDENFHYYETPEGAVVMADADGFMRYAEIGSDGNLCAGPVRVGDTPSFTLAASDIAVRSAAAKVRRNANPGEIKNSFPTTGVVRGLIILAEYQDVKMSELFDLDYYDKMLNGENWSDGRFVGSVRDYFVSQSQGKFTPQFDVVGPVCLPHNRAYYGLTENYIDHMRDACMVADKDFGVDFTRYDANNDGFVDFVFVIYAGHGEAQGGSAESMWPAMMDFSNKIYDYFDGLNLSVGACSCELSGNELATPARDGIGTICHEYSHILGLPDVYDTANGDGYGMGHFDLLGNGGYNGDSFVPSSYTAMDRYYVGWLEPRVLEASQKDLTLAPIATSGEAYFIVNPDNANEYYTLENRQWTGWDEQVPGHGLVISQVTYDPSLWARNIVNTPGRSGTYEHVKIVAADNNWDYNGSDVPRGSGSEAGDPFPGTKNNTAFSTTTKPAASWLSSKGTPCKFAIDNIREMEDGTVMFDFLADSSGVEEVVADGGLVYDRNAQMLKAEAETQIFTLSGVWVRTIEAGNHSLADLDKGIYVAVSGSNSIKIVK